MKQLTKDQAITFYASEIWKDWTHRQIAEFQMLQDKLCIPFGVFHEALEKAIGRPVWTHELGKAGRDSIMAELFEGKEPPTMKEIIELIPAEKRIILKA